MCGGGDFLVFLFGESFCARSTVRSWLWELWSSSLLTPLHHLQLDTFLAIWLNLR